MNVWGILDIQATGDEREIKRAYARRLKLTRPEDDVSGFLELREAYEAALKQAATAAPRQARDVATIEPGMQSAPEVAHAPFWDSGLTDPPAGQTFGDHGKRLWEQFVREAGASPKKMLNTLQETQFQRDLALRDVFELHAVHHCAQECCDEQWREALSEYFRWEYDSHFIRRQLPDETRAMLTRLRVLRNERAFNRLTMAAHHDDAIGVLLGTRKVSLLRTFDQDFIARLREVAALIRSEHAELLYDKLDYAAFERWETLARNRRFFRQHAQLSMLFGFLLWMFAVNFLVREGEFFPDALVLLFASLLTALAGGAGLVLQFGREPVQARS